MLRAAQFATGIVLLIALEISQVYFIARTNMGDFLDNNIFYFRIIGLLIILFPAFYFFTMGTRRSKVLVGMALGTYAFIFYLVN